MYLVAVLYIALALALVGVLFGSILTAVGPTAVDGSTFKREAIRLVVLLVGWLVVTCLLGLTSSSSLQAFPPSIPLLFTALLVMVWLPVRRGQLSAILLGLPLWLPIAIQTFRLVVELGLWLMYVFGSAPKQITLIGYNFDILAGLTAPLVAFAVHRDWIGNHLIIIWNYAGLACLATAVWSIATSTPGPFQLDWPGTPFTAITQWPALWVPSFFAPIAVWLHILSLKQGHYRSPSNGDLN